MKGTQPVQVQIETQGAVPEGMPELAIAKVDSLLRLAAEPVLHARVRQAGYGRPPGNDLADRTLEA